jgi:hypothetical protein
LVEAEEEEEEEDGEGGGGGGGGWRRRGDEIPGAERMARMIHLERLPHELQAIKLQRASISDHANIKKLAGRIINRGAKLSPPPPPSTPSHLECVCRLLRLKEFHERVAAIGCPDEQLRGGISRGLGFEGVWGI